jgi:hypothetical protein
MVSYTAVKHIAFVHEIIARKWVYYGYILEHFPKIYYKLADLLSYQDLGLIQILLCCDNFEGCEDELSTRPLIETLISNFYVDP